MGQQAARSLVARLERGAENSGPMAHTVAPSLVVRACGLWTLDEND